MYYAIVLDPDDNDTLLVTCPALPEVTSFGSDEADACARAVDAIRAALAHRMEERQDIPAPLDTDGPDRVALPPTLAGKLTLYRLMRAQGVGQSELARRLGWNEKQVRRLLDPTHRSQPEDIARGLEAIGWRLVVTVAPVAA